MRAVFRHVVGWTCLLVGLVGLWLPILQGWLFIAIGALLLSRDVPVFARLVCWVEGRSPRVRAGLDRLRRWLHRTGNGVPPCPPSG